MTIFQLAPAVEAIETIATIAAKAYAVGSEIFTVTAILWCLNFLASAIEKVYAAGYHFGKFYRAYLHQWVLKFIAGVIFLCILAWEGAVIVHKNRHKYLPALDEARHWIGAQFAYA
jgi:hypothetical protein